MYSKKEKPKNELNVVVKAKELCSYLLVVTQKCPKTVRYVFTTRIQNYALDTIEQIFRANDTFVQKGDEASLRIRLAHQHKAMSNLKLLSYMAMLGRENHWLTPKQHEMITGFSSECQNSVGAWIKSDKQRFWE